MTTGPNPSSRVRRSAHREIRPRDVAGYQRARSAGLLPAVPEEPPALLPGRTAHGEFRLLLAGTAAAVAALLVLAEVLVGTDGLSTVSSIVVLAAGVAVVVLVRHLRRRVGDRVLDELACGYTTQPLTFGTMWRSSRWRVAERRVPWDHAGTWVLDSSGQVVSAPDHGIEPPGFYPSPSVPGSYELWTGATWTGMHRSPPIGR